MYQKVARTITTLVILLMFLEILGAAATTSPLAPDYTATIHSQKSKCSFLGSFLFEEETDKTEEEKDGMKRVVLIDFSQIAVSLSSYHTPQVYFTASAFLYDVRPPLHQINCVFIV